MGGCATILVYLIFAWWMVLDYLEVYAGGGKFTVSTTTSSLNMHADASFPEYSIESDQMFLSYKFSDEGYNKTI